MWSKNKSPCNFSPVKNLAYNLFSGLLFLGHLWNEVSGCNKPTILAIISIHRGSIKWFFVFFFSSSSSLSVFSGEQNCFGWEPLLLKKILKCSGTFLSGTFSCDLSFYVVIDSLYLSNISTVEWSAQYMWTCIIITTTSCYLHDTTINASYSCTYFSSG